MRKIGAAILLVGGTIALCGCGQRSGLSVAPGHQLPPAPYGKSVQPTADELLEPPTIAIPERSVELRTRSETREDDPYDLPPPEAGLKTAPAPTPTSSAAADGNSGN